MDFELASSFKTLNIADESTAVDNLSGVQPGKSNAGLESQVANVFLDEGDDGELDNENDNQDDGLFNDLDGVGDDHTDYDTALLDEPVATKAPAALGSGLSFTANQAKFDIEATINKIRQTGKSAAKAKAKRKATTRRVAIFSRTTLDDTSRGRVRIDLYLQVPDEKDFTKVTAIESPEFAAFTITAPKIGTSTVRMVYSALDDDDEWTIFGYVTTDLDAIVSTSSKKSTAVKKMIRSSVQAEHVGSVIITAEEIRSSPFSAVFELGIKNHNSKQARYVSIQRLIKGIGMVTVYTTTLPASQGLWEQFKIPARRLCGGDVNLEICLVVKEVDKTGEHHTVGHIVRTLQQLEQLQGQTIPLELEFGQHLKEIPELEIRRCLLQDFRSVAKSTDEPSTRMQKLTTTNKLALRTLQKEKARNSVPALHKRPTGMRQRSFVSRPHGCLSVLWHDFLLWLETQPLTRFANTLPVRRTVVAISMKFGTGVSAFFALFNWLMGLNLLLSIVWFALAVVPRASDMKEGSTAQDTLVALFGIRDPQKHSTALWAWYGDYTASSVASPYHDEVSSRGCCDGVFPDDSFNDLTSQGRAYAWAVIVSILLSFFHITFEAWKTFNSLDTTFNDPEKELEYKFASTVFGGWDHTCGTSNFRKSQTVGLCHDYKLLLKASELADARVKLKRKSQDEKIVLYSRRAFFIALSIVFGVGAIATIVWVTNDQDSLEKEFVFLPSIILSSVNILVPLVIDFCVKNELWEDHALESQNLIGREFLIRVTNTYTLFYQLRLKISASDLASSNYECVQDLIGNTFLRLYVTECVADLFHAFFWPLRSRWQLHKPHYFAVPDNVLNLIYRQLIVWTALPYSPVMTFAALVGSFVCFMWRSFSCQRLSTPSPSPWPEAKARLFFLKMMLLTCVVALAPQIHFLYTEASPNPDNLLACGPHVNWASKPQFSSVFTYLVNWDSVPSWIREIMIVIFHPIFLVVCLLVMVIVMVWLQKFLLVTRQELRSVSADLADEHHDKMALLRNAGLQV